MSEVIDLTPTYAESARVCAYWLGNQSNKRVEDFIGGDYWGASRTEQEVAVITFNKVQTVIKALDAIGVSFYKQSQVFKTRVVMGAFEKAKTQHLAE